MFGSNDQHKSHQTSYARDNKEREDCSGVGVVVVVVVIELQSEELKLHKGKMDGLKMKSPDVLEHYEDREHEEWRRK